MSNYTLMAHFNAWANRAVYAAAVQLPDAAYREDRGAFFGSIHATLNHLLLVDKLWTARLQGGTEHFSSLSEILHENLGELTAARVAEDQRLIAEVEALGAEQLAGSVTFTMMSQPGEAAMPRDHILLTIYNHQTHHRGQVHCMLTQAGGPALELDVPVFLSQR